MKYYLVKLYYFVEFLVLKAYFWYLKARLFYRDGRYGALKQERDRLRAELEKRKRQ